MNKIKTVAAAFIFALTVNGASLSAVNASTPKKLTSAEIFELTDDVMAKLLYDTPELTFGTLGGEWTAVSLSRSGCLSADSELFEKYRETVAEKAAELSNGISPEGALNKFKSTENSRAIIALSSIKADPTDVNGLDLTAPYNDLEWVTKQGINSSAYALIALNSCNFPRNDKAVDRCIIHILEKQLDDGGWAITGKNADPDVTAIALQAIAPFRDEASIAAAIEKGIAILSKMQTKSGGYKSLGRENSNSCSQVMIACTELGIDPQKDERFIKNGISLFDSFMSYYNEETKDFSRFAGEEGDRLATEQAACALTAYERYLSGKPSFYSINKASSGTVAVPLYREEKSGKIAIAASSNEFPGSGCSVTFSLGEDTSCFYYAPEISEIIDKPVYLGFVDPSVDLHDLTSVKSFMVNYDDNEKIIFGDADGNSKINAQDVMTVVNIWAGREKSPENRLILSLNVDGGSTIDTADAECIKDHFISGADFPINEKICCMLED